MSVEARPNILFITTDQQRTDTLGVYGSRQVKTPHVDALARQGTLFERAYSQNTVCIPARTSMATGRYIHQHTVDYMEEVIDDTPPTPAWERTIPERLQTAGYHTAAFGKLHVWPERGYDEKITTGGKGARWTKSAGLPFGLGPLGRDYAAWLEARHPGGYELIYEQRRRPEYRKFRSALDNVLPLEEYVDWWITQNTIDFLKRGHDRPFYVQCGFCGPHDPMDPPEPYCRMYDPDEVELPPNYRINLDGSPRDTTEEEDAIARYHIAHYWGLVTLIDDMVGKIVATLEETGLVENTLVIYVSDHGEMLWERGRLAKSFFYEPIIRMPMIVVPPKGVASCGTGAPACAKTSRPGAAGPHVKTVSGIVETFDLAPTMLDYARAGIPPEMTAASLRPLIESGGSGKEVALSEFVASDRSFRTVCAVTGRFKYVWSSGVRPEEFFDLANDPLERTNLIDEAEHQGEIARHRKLMIDRLSAT
ncbi:MAG TPA: sulfatase-like hydrolase/transferase [Planctomycetota bacterium]|nr:sulfatase-like hydrolase/transferase [Planctomycetota bacterium]